MPAAKPARASRGRPRRRSRTPLSDGRADDDRQGHRPGEHVGVLPGEAAPACGRQRRAVSRHAGCQRGGLGETEGETVGGRRGPAVPDLGPAIRDHHAGRAHQQPKGGRDRPTESPLDRLLEHDAEQRRREEGERDHRGLAAVEGPQLFGDHPPLPHEQRGGGTRVQRDLEALLQLGVPPVRVPPGEPRNQGEMGGAGDRKQLGRPLHGAEDDRPRPFHQPSGAGSTCPLRRLITAQTIRAMIATTTA